MAIATADIQNWFTYHPPTPNQVERYAALRDGAKTFAELVLALTPASADQTVAIRKIREAVMVANAAIACEEIPARVPGPPDPPRPAKRNEVG